MPRAALACLCAALLAACAGRPAVQTAPPPATLVEAASTDLGTRAAALATQLVGTPYVYGGSTTAGFDCSGLVWYVYHELGAAVPRTAAEQRAAAAHVDADALQPGDLVFFYTPAEHVGLYLGGGEFVHAPASGRRVERARLDSPYFILSYEGGGRIAGP